MIPITAVNFLQNALTDYQIFTEYKTNLRTPFKHKKHIITLR